MPESGDFFGPLGLGDLETPEKRGRFINIEAIDAYIEKATMETVTITTGTLVDITVSGTSTLNDVTINDASIVDATITNADINGGTFGSATIDGDLVVGAWLSLTTSGGIRTQDSTTLQRIEITNAENNTITFYSGASNETDPVLLYQNDNGTGGTRTIQMNLGTGLIDHTGYGGASQIDAKGSFVVRTGSPDGTSFAPGWVFAQTAASSGGGQDLEIRIQNSIPLITDGDIYLAAGGAVGFGTSYDDQFYQISDGVLGIKIGGTKVWDFDATYAGSDAATGTPQLKINAAGSATTPAYSFQGDTNTGMYRISADQIGFAVGGAEAVRITSAKYLLVGGLTTGMPYVKGSAAGSAAAPSYAFYDDADTGMYRPAANQIGFSAGNSNAFLIDSGVVVTQAPLFRLPVKGTTGDPTATDNGDMYVNSVDNVLKVYEGGSWRTVASW